MAIPTEKKCTRCNEVKPADAFGVTTAKGKQYLRGRCNPCGAAYMRDRCANDPAVREAQKAYQRDRRANDPEYREAHNACRRDRYANDVDYRHRCLERDQERLALTSTRVRRIHALLDHFATRQAWIDRIASIVMKRPDAAGLQWLSSRIDDICAHHCEA